MPRLPAWLLLLGVAAGSAYGSALRLPPGFVIEVFADGIPGARSLALGEHGTLFVGTRQLDVVYALRDEDADGYADQRWILARGLRMPNGVAFRDGALYVAENHRILRFDGIEERLDDPPEPSLIARLPDKSHHGWRYLGFGPDGMLYLGIGAPCNICDEPGFATIVRMPPAGGEPETVARGVRNTLGFDWHPATGELWFTDNGRDWLGDDVPPDELNRLSRPEQHFGYPYCHGGTIIDPEYGQGRDCADFQPPMQPLGAHVAPLGMRFYRGGQFPAEYRGQIFIAEHGSWNRSTPVGYRISLVRVEAGRAVSYEPFVEGWLSESGSVNGRPVDLLELPDGSLLVSDDQAGRIHRIRYGGR